MKRVLSVSLVLVMMLSMMVGLAGCGEESLEEKIPETFINETLEFKLTDPMPVPAAKEGSDRGEAIEKLVTLYATSFENDPYLAEDVKLFRQWRWAELYASLDQKTKEEPLHLNTFRMQAEVYLTNSKYNEALAALDSVLRVHHDDIYSLALSAYIKHFMGNEEQSQQRLQALRNVSEECYQDMVEFIAKVDAWRNEEHGTGLDNTENLSYDVIGVLGVSPTATGGLSASAVLRLKEAIKAAYYCPDAIIVLSGGAIDYDFAEAEVMRDYLLKWSTDLAIALELEPEGSNWKLDESRIIMDLEARDTVGNAFGIFKVIEEKQFKNLLVVGSTGQVMRANCIFKAYADANNLDVTISTVGSGNVEACDNEYKYAYVGAARAYGLFTMDDFEKYKQ
jgi:uncharacterized SAM-binding protein YcdF (DUF218 family)